MLSSETEARRTRIPSEWCKRWIRRVRRVRGAALRTCGSHLRCASRSRSARRCGRCRMGSTARRREPTRGPQRTALVRSRCRLRRSASFESASRLTPFGPLNGYGDRAAARPAVVFKDYDVLGRERNDTRAAHETSARALLDKAERPAAVACGTLVTAAPRSYEPVPRNHVSRYSCLLLSFRVHTVTSR